MENSTLESQFRISKKLALQYMYASI